MRLGKRNFAEQKPLEWKGEINDIYTEYFTLFYFILVVRLLFSLDLFFLRKVSQPKQTNIL